MNTSLKDLSTGATAMYVGGGVILYEDGYGGKKTPSAVSISITGERSPWMARSVSTSHDFVARSFAEVMSGFVYTPKSFPRTEGIATVSLDSINDMANGLLSGGLNETCLAPVALPKEVPGVENWEKRISNIYGHAETLRNVMGIELAFTFQISQVDYDYERSEYKHTGKERAEVFALPKSGEKDRIEANGSIVYIAGILSGCGQPLSQFHGRGGPEPARALLKAFEERLGIE